MGWVVRCDRFGDVWQLLPSGYGTTIPWGVFQQLGQPQVEFLGESPTLGEEHVHQDEETVRLLREPRRTWLLNRPSRARSGLRP